MAGIVGVGASGSAGSIPGDDFGGDFATDFTVASLGQGIQVGANALGRGAVGAVHAPGTISAKSQPVTGVAGVGTAHAFASTTHLKALTGVAGHGAVGSPVRRNQNFPAGVAAHGAAGVARGGPRGLALGRSATGAVGTLRARVSAFVTGVGGRAVTNQIVFSGSARSASVVGVGGLAVVHALVPGPSGFVFGVSASTAVNSFVSGYTPNGVGGVAVTHAPGARPGGQPLGRVGHAATHAVTAKPGGRATGVVGHGAVGVIARATVSRRINGAKGVGRAFFAWRTGFFGLVGVSAHAQTEPTGVYYFGNNSMVTNNPLGLIVTSIPVGSTTPPTDEALVVHSTVAGAPIWWNGLRWQLLWGSAANMPALPGYIHGLYPFNVGGSASAAFLTVKRGACTDSSETNLQQLVADTAWAVANGNAINGFDGGTTLPGSSTIHFYECTGTAGTGVFATTVTPPAAPTFPPGYVGAYRRIFSLPTDVAGAPLPYVVQELSGGGLLCYYAAPRFDVGLATPGTGSRTLYPVSVPVGRSMQWLGRVIVASGTGQVLVTSPMEPDIPPSTSAAPLFDESVGSGGDTTFSQRPVVTDVSGNIGVRANGVLAVDVATVGFIDYRI